MSTKLNPAEMVWEDPPPRRTRAGTAKYSQTATALRANPNQWAVIRTWPKEHIGRAGNFATSVKKDVLVDFRGGFEAIARTVGDEARVYARYVGTGDES